MPQSPQYRSRRADEFESELDAIITAQQRRDRQRRSDDEWTSVKRHWEAFKTILPWAIAIAAFLWQAGGSWSGVISSSRRLDDLEKTIKREYVTKESFEPVAADVRDIRNWLYEDRQRERRARAKEDRDTP